ncbi:hypothetical protein PVAND_014564 [Polypedilum vanderplanki]|uniref:Uncharacterized protein n=1 Tax=Polypedilum vanderplanki TaxID=319348 RepID=A0A9J6BA12_POLVA|nr:hypothetical protein PVAND_014564 [Polypedilum vanderplanki]
MGLKVNLFMAFFAVLGFYNLPSFFFFLIYFCLMILYNYWKNWQFLSKFPGGKKISLSGIFLNSPNEFYDYVEKLWNNYGKDKFVLWIGFERIVAVSKLDDIKVSKNIKIH